MRVGVLFLLALVLSASPDGADALFGKKKQEKQRRRLTEERGNANADVDVDVDAATGTVKPIVVNEQKNVCEGQIAKSMVKADDDLQQAHAERDEAVGQKDQALAKIENLQAIVQELETAVKNSKQKSNKNDKEIQAKVDAQLELVEADRDAKISEIQAQLDVAVKEGATLLQTTKDEAKKYMVAQVNTVKDEMTQKEKTHSTALKEKSFKIKQLEAQNKKLLEAEKKAEAHAIDAEEELAHWRATFGNRSYCNMTHIGDDLYYASQAAYNQTAQAVSTAAGHTSQAAKTAASSVHVNSKYAYGEMKVKAGQGYEKSRAVYNDQYEKQWPKVKPHYDQHVNPVVEHFYAWKVKEFDPHWKVVQQHYTEFKTNQFDPRYNTVKQEYNKRFGQVVKFYGTECKEALKMAQRLAKEHDFAFDDSIGPYMGYSCQEPELSVTYIQRGLILLLLLPFVRPVLRLVFRILGFFWGMIVFFTPLRFFVSRKKSQPSKDVVKKKTNGGVRVKKKKARVASQ